MTMVDCKFQSYSYAINHGCTESCDLFDIGGS